MDKDRFQHIVDENKAMRDMHIAELVSHTIDLQKQVIKSKQPSFFSRMGSLYVESATSPGSSEGFSALICYVVIPLVLIIISWSSYGIFRAVIDDVRETATGKWYEEPAPYPDQAPLSFSLSSDNKCHTIVTKLNGGRTQESGCIENPYDALMIIRDLEHIRLQSLNGGGLSESFVSMPKDPIQSVPPLKAEKEDSQ